MNADIDPAEIEKVKIDDEKAVKLFADVRGMTADQDSQILRILDDQLQSRNLNIDSCKPTQFDVTKDLLRPESTLQSYD